MKRYILLPIMLAVLAFPLALSGAMVTHSATYDASKLHIGTAAIDGVTYSTVSYDGLYNRGEVGAPWLPVEYFKFSVPYNAVNFTVSATTQRYTHQQLSYPVYPRQASDSGNATPADSMIYCSGMSYPSTVAWVSDEGMLAGENHVVTVAVVPVVYMPQNGSNRLIIAMDVTLTLSYELSDTPNVCPQVRKGAIQREEGRKLTQSAVVNPDDVAGNAVPLSSPLIQTRFNFDEEPLDSVENPDTYMIIATDASLRPLRRLAALKKQEGYGVKMVTISEALIDPIALPGDSCYQGPYHVLSYTDDAGKLRQYLRHHYFTRGTKYVLLAGTGVPFRQKAHSYADIYFSELTVDWYQGASTYFELNVGRLLGTSAAKFDNYTDKLLRYELNPGNGDFSYLTRGLSIESALFQTYAPTPWASAFNVTSLDVFDIENPTEYTGRDVVDLINSSHYGVVSTFNDGFPSGVKIYETPDINDSITTHYLWAIDSLRVAPDITDTETGNGLNLLNNKNYPMVYVSSMGVTMPYEAIEGYGNGANYGESFTMGKDYGGPAFFGMTGRGYRYFSYYASTLGDGVFYRIMNGYPLGLALNEAKYYLDTDEHIDVISAGNLLGDPSLEVWTAQPQQYSGITLTRTDNAVTVSGLTEPSTIVCYHSNDGTTGTCKTSSSSVTLTGVSPNSTIMLKKHNFIPYIAPLVLQNTDLAQSQYVFATDVTAGRSVDSGRTTGDVTVKEGSEYEIEASGEVTLAGGFKVELGARLSVQRSSYK